MFLFRIIFQLNGQKSWTNHVRCATTCYEKRTIFYVCSYWFGCVLWNDTAKPFVCVALIKDRIFFGFFPSARSVSSFIHCWPIFRWFFHWPFAFDESKYDEDVRPTRVSNIPWVMDTFFVNSFKNNILFMNGMAWLHTKKKEEKRAAVGMSPWTCYFWMNMPLIHSVFDLILEIIFE